MTERVERFLSHRSLAWFCVVAVVAAYAIGFLLHYPRTVTLTDESLYLTQAKLIAEGPLMRPWGGAVTQWTDCGDGAVYPVGTPLAIAPLYRLGGLRLAFVFPLIMLLAGVLMTARWIDEQGLSPCFALLMLFFLPYFVLGRVSTSGIPSALLVACGMWCFWRGVRGPSFYWGLAGLIAGLSFMFRETNVLAFAPLFVGTLVRRERQAWWVIAGGLCGLVTHIAVSTMLGYPVINVARSMGFGLTAFRSHIPIYLVALLILFPGGLIWGGAYRGARYPELRITVLLWFLFYSAYGYSGQQSGSAIAWVLGPRFIIPLLPVLALASAEVVPRLWRAMLVAPSTSRIRLSVLTSRTMIMICVLGLGVFSYAVHPAFAMWARKHARAQELIYSHTADEDVIVTDLKGTEKYINPLYGQRTVMKYDELEPGDLEGMLAADHAIWIVILERRDSEYWLDRTTRAMQFVASLSPAPALSCREKLSPNYTLWVWRMDS